MSDVNSEIIAKTQKYLGKYVKKPALTEKLLRKPPFRFLHDVVKVVIQETGFLKGLFTDDELNSENVKDKEAKVAFLTKLIEAVKVVSNTQLKVRPNKIVAGLEPNETNILLQTIGKSIHKKIDTSEYVAKLHSGEIIQDKAAKKESKPDKEKKSTLKENNKKESKVRESSLNRVKKRDSIETPKSTDRRESSRTKTNEEKLSKSTKSREKLEKTNKVESKHNNKNKHKGDGDQVPETKIEINGKEENGLENQKTVTDSGAHNGVSSKETANNVDLVDRKSTEILGDTREEAQPDDNQTNQKQETDQSAIFSNARQGSAGLVRPKSARPKSGDRGVSSSRGRGDRQEDGRRKEESKPVEMKVSTASAARPGSSLRPPSVRPSSARPGAPRLRPESALKIAEPVVMGNINVIVENFDSGLGDEDETVVIQTALEAPEDGGISSDLLNISGEKGQLVEQILEQIQEGENDGPKKRVEIDWELDGLRGKDATTKEVTHLRSVIQSLTKTANPLGKLMSYLHEDLDAMHNELQMWTNTKKQLRMEIEKQKKLSIESSKPLLTKLEHLKEEIKKQEQEILIVRSNILRNDQRIAELLGK